MRIANAIDQTGSLPFVLRFNSAILLCLALTMSYGQRREGVYRPAGGQATAWKINDQGTLIWGSDPYVPIGVRVEPNAASIAAAKKAGIHDVIVDLPASGAGWTDVFSALEAADMRYVLRIGSLAPLAQGIAVEPQGYRVTGITTSKRITVPIPEAKSALVVLAIQQSAIVQDTRRVPIVDGVLSYDVGQIAGVEHVLLIYPELKGQEATDFWSGFDAQRDSILSALRRCPPGKGLRAIVNPLGRILSLPSRDLRFVPSDPSFQSDFATLLENRYRNLETLFKQWSMPSSDLSSSVDKDGKLISSGWRDLARLVPLWSGSRGLPILWDPKTDKTYPCENKRSRIWLDLSDAIHGAASRRLNRLVSSIHAVVDVPVIQEWIGWSTPYETINPAFDGLGVRTVGSRPSQITETASRAASSTLRWPHPGFLAATDVELGSASASTFPAVADDLTSMGARAVFLRADTPAALQAAADAAKRIADVGLNTSFAPPVYFPENAMNPAAPQKLPGGRWWLPTPADGNRIDLGTAYSAYRLSAPNGHQVVLWARQPGRVVLKLANSKGVVFTSCDGSDPKPKNTKAGIEIMLTECPMIITGTEEIPIPEPAYRETVGRFAMLAEESVKRRRDINEERMSFSDAFQGFERNPGGSFSTMRQEFQRASLKLAPFVWIEAERSVDHNFSEASPSAGSSGGSSLVLRTSLTPEGGFHANYDIPVRSKLEQEVWISARIAPEKRGELSVIIGGQELTIAGDGESPYGNGFAWYKLGVTRLSGQSSKVRVNVQPTGPSDLAIDTILLTPYPFHPNGVCPPDALDFSIKPVPKKDPFSS